MGDLVLVTTRYFGGTKLGTGGLVYAYTNAAKQALTALEVEEKVTRRYLGVTIPYHLYERLKQITERYEGIVQDEEFAAEITRYLTLPEEHLEPFTAELRELSAGQVTPILLDE
jgi:putative IMPACT (imprinted ancient) family translation regulator